MKCNNNDRILIKPPANNNKIEEKNNKIKSTIIVFSQTTINIEVNLTIKRKRFM